MFRISRAKFEMMPNGDVSKCLEYKDIAVEKTISEAFFVYDALIYTDIEKLDLDEDTADRTDFNGILEHADFYNKDRTLRVFYLIMREADNE